ncbi:hypothetical protein BIT28_16845 [Photobacterium proteolyticum]|uniref:DUF721 domain-containing protein n=2 Tax=Photobacterium TaxID=657 RepID=A0A1Q9GZ23_9GAMM|nr:MULTISPECIES: DciA family protein [Photobacterium]NBI53560.1 DUF721 domain-containing protein [Photobacterium alginatilyticum]OLQ80401.1 hypothetical protein BIT28_16845 [Photobacterium proteolyticum]
MRDHRPRTTASLLDDSQIGNIQQRAIALSKLDKAVKQHLDCSDHCRVSNYRQGTLIIETASASWSMRLNYERNNLIRKLREQLLPQLASIEVKVNPALAAVERKQEDKAPDIVQKPISPLAAQYLLTTAKNAPDKVKKKLERLAALAANKRRE